jgi:hypothetical protein
MVGNLSAHPVMSDGVLELMSNFKVAAETESGQK